MLKTFKLRPKTDHDLQKIYTYSVKQWVGSRAEQYIKDIETAFQKVAKIPALAYEPSQLYPTSYFINLILSELRL